MFPGLLPGFRSTRTPDSTLSRPVPRALRLPLHAVATRDGLLHHVARTLAPPRSDLARVVHGFAFKCDERTFAHQLLVRRTQLWVYRSHQAAASGDFVVVDRSGTTPDRRRVWVVELKRGRPVHFGGSWQLRNADAVLAELADHGTIGPGVSYTSVVGDTAAVLAWFGTS